MSGKIIIIIIIIELCQDGKCVEAARIGTFGAAADKSSRDYQEPPPIDDKNYFLRDTDVTAVVYEQGWTLEKTLEARMTDSVLDNLPEPVVIVKELGGEGNMDMGKDTIILSPHENSHNYGNLLKSRPKTTILTKEQYMEQNGMRLEGRIKGFPKVD